MLEKKSKRYALLMCGEDSEYLLKRHGGCYGFFTRMLAEEGERWDLYKVVNGEFPDDDDVSFYDGFVITGSCHDAHANDPWIHNLLTFVHKLNSINKKILGICFGHQQNSAGRSRTTLTSIVGYMRGQFTDKTNELGTNNKILGRALGGKVGRSIAGWDIGVTTINVLSSNKLLLPSKLSLFKCHRDEVRDLPAKAEIIGWSEATGVEMFRYGDNLLGIQGHPEFTTDILLHFIDRLIHRNLIQVGFGVDVKAKAALWEPDREAWRSLCLAFLKGH